MQVHWLTASKYFLPSQPNPRTFCCFLPLEFVHLFLTSTLSPLASAWKTSYPDKNSFVHWFFFFFLGQKPRAPEAGSCLVQEQEVGEVRSYNLSMRDHEYAPGNSKWIPWLGWQPGCSLGIASFLKKSLYYYSYPSLCDCVGLNGNTWFVLC